MAHISEPLAPAAEQPLFAIDENTEIIWLENMPEPPKLEEDNTELIWPANPPDAPEFKEQEPPEQPAASIGIRDE
ncbi:hypothetical protein ACHAPD_007744 [Fusarium lateritium]